MIDLNYIREYPEKFSELMQQRNVNVSIEKILKLDKNKKLKISELLPIPFIPAEDLFLLLAAAVLALSIKTLI